MMNATPQVLFEESTHTYSVDGTVWPSVTSILNPLMELDGIPRATLEAAAAFGRHVHLATDLWDRGILDESDLDEPLRPYLEGWKKFLRDTGAVVLETERLVSHPTLKIAGRLDKLIGGLVKGRSILDIKTSLNVHWTVALQTAAYREMLSMEELMGSSRGCNILDSLSKTRHCCHLLPDATYRLYTIRDYDSDWNAFLSCVNFHRLRMQHAFRKL
jgi:hypothetical protein